MSGSGTKNSKWSGGIHLSSKGYKRISTRTGRNKYLHRYLIEQLLENPIAAWYVFPDRGQIPKEMEIHHWDHRNTHNCYGNLQLLDRRIHVFCEKEYKRYVLENFEEWGKFWKEDGRWE